MSYSLLLIPTPSLVRARCSPAPPAIVLAIACPGARLAPGVFSHEDPFVLGAAEVLLAPLPMLPAVQEIGWDLCHQTVTEPWARSPGWSLLLPPPPGSGSLLGQVVPLLGVR